MTEGQLGQDTSPLPYVQLPSAPIAAARAAGDVSSVLLVRVLVAGLATVLLLLAAVLLFRHGVQPDDFPPYATGTTRTVIDRYSGPWIGGAAIAALLAGLSFTSAGVDLFRRLRLQHTSRAA